MKLSTTIKQRVHQILIDKPQCRDSDLLLMWELWMEDLPLHNLTSFKEMFISGKLVNPENARRFRQLIQSKFPELRGTMYAERHGYQIKVKDHLKSVA